MSQKNCSCYLKIYFAFKLKIKILINLIIKNRGIVMFKGFTQEHYFLSSIGSQ